MSLPAEPPRASATDAAPAYDLRLCLAWTSGWLVSAIVMAMSIRALGAALTAFELLALRNFSTLATLVGLAVLHPGTRRDWRLRRPLLQIVRNLLHFAGQYAWVQSVVLLPLAVVFALEFTSPVFLALLAAPLLGERLTASRFAAVALGFLGILIIVRPGIGGFEPLLLLPLGGALLIACTTVATKQLTRTETALSIVIWMTLIQLPLNLISLSATFVAQLTAAPPLPIAGVCLAGMLSQLCLASAYRRGDALTVVPLDFLRLPGIAIIAALVFAEPLDPLVFGGAAIILGGVTWNLWIEARSARRWPVTDRRRPAISVTVLSWPCGTEARNLRPRRQRPHWRAMAVDTPACPRVGGGLVDEHQPVRIEVALLRKPSLALLQNVRALLLLHMRGRRDVAAVAAEDQSVDGGAPRETPCSDTDLNSGGSRREVPWRILFTRACRAPRALPV